MEGDCSTKSVQTEVKPQNQQFFLPAAETSPKRRKRRNRVREKSNRKKVLFNAGFQVSEISHGVHLSDVKEENLDTATQGKLERCMSGEDGLDEEEVDDFIDYFEDYDFTNRKSSNKLLSSSSGNCKPNRGCPPGLMKVAEENKASRRVWNVAKNYSAQKDNIGKRLEEQGLKKFGFDIYERRAQSSKRRSGKSCYSANSSRRNKKNEDHPAALRYELKSHNIPQDAGSHLEKVIDLQHRDLTPEDYELLLMLDESIARKTVSRNLLQSLPVLTAEAAEIIGELCSICMELYNASQTVKKLPCAHAFHEQCIDMWLSNSSLNCPLDGLAVEVT